MNLIAIDVGFGFTKAVTRHGQRVCFPSAVAAARGDGDLGRAVGAGAPGHQVTVTTRAGPQRLLVGDAALASGAVRSWDPAAARRHDYAALVLTALGLLATAAVPAGPTDLAVGLPLAGYLQRPQRQALRDQLSGLRGSVQVDGAAERRVEIGTVRVFPQAVGAFVHAASSDPAATAGAIGVLDLGYRTSDLLLLQPGVAGPVPDEARSTSLEAGIGQACEGVSHWLEGHAAIMVPPGVIDTALAGTGLLPVSGQTYDVRGMFEAEVRALAARIVDDVRRRWADRLAFLSVLLVAGGGGHAAFAHLRCLHPTARLMPDAVFANALGFLDMAAASATV